MDLGEIRWVKVTLGGCFEHAANEDAASPPVYLDKDISIEH